jgi:hypothetical protein
MLTTTTTPAPLKRSEVQTPGEAPLTVEPMPSEEQPTLPRRDPSRLPPPIVVPTEPGHLPKLPPLRPGCV